jgi:hypothetical protein
VLSFSPGSDTSFDILSLGVTGTPKLSWDETNDLFRFNKNMVIGETGTGTHTIGGANYTSGLEVHAEGDNELGGLAVHRHGDTFVLGAHLLGMRSRNTHASPTIVQSGDNLVGIYGAGFDGTDYALSAKIAFEVDGTPGANDMPGRIVFQTSADGGQTLGNALVISNDKKSTFSGTIDTALTTAGPTIVDSSGVLSSEAQLAAARGGTGQDFSSSTGAVSVSGGTFSVGTLSIANGGTSAGTKAAAFDALSPMTTAYDLIYGGASGTGTRLATGTSGQFLKTNGTGSAPEWASVTVTPTAPTAVKTANYTVGANDSTVQANTSSAGFTVTLPTAIGVDGKRYTIIVTTGGPTLDGNSHVLDIATTSSQTIGGLASAKLSSTNDSITVESDGSNWNIVYLNVKSSALATAVSKNLSPTQPCDFSSVNNDSLGQITTGASWKFTAFYPGTYQVNVTLTIDSIETVDIYKNGSFHSTVFVSETTNNWGSGGVAMVLAAGDYIDIRAATSRTTSAAGARNVVSITRTGW